MLTSSKRADDQAVSRWLVTGASGFVGQALSVALSCDGERVRALLRRERPGPWQEARIGDLALGALPRDLMAGVEGVFHLAGLAHAQDMGRGDEAIYRAVNVAGTQVLLDAAAQAGVPRFLYLSSVKAAGDAGEDCVDETWDAAPSDAYGRTKREAEALVLEAGRRTGMHVCVLRPTLVYGPGVKGNLARMMDSVARGRFPPLPETRNRRSMVGLNDLIAAARLALSDPRAAARTYIVEDGIPYSSRQIYEAMCRAMQRPVPRWAVPLGALRGAAAMGDVVERLLGRKLPIDKAVLERLTGSACYSSARIRQELNWESRQTFFDVLPAMVEARLGGDQGGR